MHAEFGAKVLERANIADPAADGSAKLVRLGRATLVLANDAFGVVNDQVALTTH